MAKQFVALTTIRTALREEGAEVVEFVKGDIIELGDLFTKEDIRALHASGAVAVQEAPEAKDAVAAKAQLDEEEAAQADVTSDEAPAAEEEASS